MSLSTLKLRPNQSNQLAMSQPSSLMEELLDNIDREEEQERKQQEEMDYWIRKRDKLHFQEQYQEERQEDVINKPNQNNTNQKKFTPNNKKRKADYEVIDLEDQHTKRFKPSYDNPEFLLSEETLEPNIKEIKSEEEEKLLSESSAGQREKQDQLQNMLDLQSELKDCTEQLKELNDTFFRQQIKLDALNERMSDIINKIFEKMS